jgi:hypothetical protein
MFIFGSHAPSVGFTVETYVTLTLQTSIESRFRAEPGPDSMVMVAPCNCATSLTIATPSPVPSPLRYCLEKTLQRMVAFRLRNADAGVDH